MDGTVYLSIKFIMNMSWEILNYIFDLKQKVSETNLLEI